jgi:hypothetical protein
MVTSDDGACHHARAESIMAPGVRHPTARTIGGTGTVVASDRLMPDSSVQPREKGQTRMPTANPPAKSWLIAILMRLCLARAQNASAGVI